VIDVTVTDVANRTVELHTRPSTLEVIDVTRYVTPEWRRSQGNRSNWHRLNMS